MRRFTMVLFALSLLVVGGIAMAIAFGGPGQPAPLRSVGDPFKTVDFSGLPPIERFIARDGHSLAYRRYTAALGLAKGSVVLIHGSAARSDSVHPLAIGFSQAGYVVYALDMRGHGESGRRGSIAYVGQLEDDVEDFLKASKPPGKPSLVGFSAGGGFALRFAADARRNMFANYLLLAPFLSQSASTYRPASGGWACVGVPRILGLVALNALGITRFNDLPVTTYALSSEVRVQLTPSYSYALAMNFRPHNDYRCDIASAANPMEVLVGENDDQFKADRFAGEFSDGGRPVPVSIVPGTGHIGLTVSTAGIDAAVQAVDRLNRRIGGAQMHTAFAAPDNPGVPMQ